MTHLVLRRLTAEGIERWRAWIRSGGAGEPPLAALSDRTTSEPVDPVVTIVPRSFVDRHELGTWLCEVLRPLDIAALRFDAGLWDWLALLLVDEICPQERGRQRKVLKDAARYCLDVADHHKRARHLVRTPWWLVREHGEAARFCLAGPPHQHSDLLEQLANRQEIVGSRVVMATAAKLYWDAAARRGKPGATTRQAPGNVRRLVDLVDQLRLTFDLDSMTAEKILALLPKEFDRFKDPTPPRRRRGLFDRLLGRGAPPQQGA